MKFRLISARSAAVSSSCEEPARALGSRNEEMGLTVAFIIARRLMVSFRESRFFLRFSDG